MWLEAASVAAFRVGNSYKLNLERLAAFFQRIKKLKKNFFGTNLARCSDEEVFGWVFTQMLRRRR